MKKVLLVLLCIFVLPLMLLLGGCTNKKNIKVRVAGEYIQWSYEGESNWRDIIDIESIKSVLSGPQGVAGKQVEFRKQDGYIQWHYVGENTWQNLISVEELQVETEQDTNPQQLAFYLLDDGTYGVGVGYATQLSSIVIPETYLGKKVTKIIENGFNSDKLKRIVIPSGITNINNDTFSNCENLQYVSCNLGNNNITIINDLWTDIKNLFDSTSFSDYVSLYDIWDDAKRNCKPYEENAKIDLVNKRNQIEDKLSEFFVRYYDFINYAKIDYPTLNEFNDDDLYKMIYLFDNVAEWGDDPDYYIISGIYNGNYFYNIQQKLNRIYDILLSDNATNLNSN